jgi:UDP-N-acetylmuramoylalanine--D-glutamate ligase
VETFGSGVPESEEEWGFVTRDSTSEGSELWLARGGSLLLSATDLTLVGRHNALNVLAAMALVSVVARISRGVLVAAAQFEGLPHRMQRIAEADGVLYVNDSKATTVVATEAALQGISRPVVLIAGGDGKGQDFARLKTIVDAHCRAVLLIGRDAPQIEQAIAGTAVEQLGTLDAAVARAFALARPGDAVVLSPACASLDQFSNYVERGERFAAAVRERIEAKSVAPHA